MSSSNEIREKLAAAIRRSAPCVTCGGMGTCPRCDSLGCDVHLLDQALRVFDAELQKPCVTVRTPTCVYLRDGTKVVPRRDGTLDVVPQATITTSGS